MSRKLPGPLNLKLIYRVCLVNKTQNRACGLLHAPLEQIRSWNQRGWRNRASAWSHEQQVDGLRGFSTSIPPDDREVKRITRVDRAKTALRTYLHCTSGICFASAEQISKNCPEFVWMILEKVKGSDDVEKELSRFFQYHPINEFEPFFESIGLKHSELQSLLRPELMFLSDSRYLLRNYSDLCNYGVAPNKIGKLYKATAEKFLFGPGLFKSKLLAYESLGLCKTTIIKLICSTPTMLLGDEVDEEFVKLLKKMEEIGLPRDLIGASLSENNSYQWDKMLGLLLFFREMGFDDIKLFTLISKHPSFLLDCSGVAAFQLISFVLKMGMSKKGIMTMLSEFPHLQVGSFTKNLQRAFQFLVEIGMNSEDIKKIICHHKEALGQIYLKRSTSILTYLGTGKKKLRKFIMDDPPLLQKFAVGLKVSPLPASIPSLKSILEEKKKFISRLGIVKNSKEMKVALKAFRGRGDELQDRFNVFIESGMEEAVVVDMVKRVPYLLTQNRESLDEKLSFIVNTLGYPLSYVAKCPHCLGFTPQRLRLRHLMYEWLKERGKAPHNLALSSIASWPEKKFIEKLVSQHPENLKAWENFKKMVSSSIG